MARQQFGNTYGNVTADGNTHVQLGDRDIKNILNIQTAYITLQDELELPQPHLLQDSQYANLAIDGLQGALTVRRTSTPRHTYKQRYADEGTSQDQPVHETLCRRLSCTQRHPQTNSAPKCFTAACDSSSSMTSPSAQNRLVLDHGQSRAVYELLLTLATILSCILGRNVSPDDLSHFIRKCQHDQFLPAMTFMLGIGLYRYFSSRRLLQNPSCLSQERITLEDAYGRTRLLSLDICGDFGVFKAFLESHYRETTAPTGEALVKAGQFNLTLGSRRGNILHPSKWRTHCITSGSRVVNSVYIKSNDGKCFVCQKTLIVSELGEFHCLSCQTFHRDCDTLREIDTIPTGSTDTVEQNPSASSRTVLYDANQYEVLGLRNLDIQIVPLDISAVLDAGGEALLADLNDSYSPGSTAHLPAAHSTKPSSSALQDYHTQLTFLEQQNKKHLLMACQKQYENDPVNDGGSRPGVGTQAPDMSQHKLMERFKAELLRLEQLNEERLMWARSKQYEYNPGNGEPMLGVGTQAPSMSQYEESRSTQEVDTQINTRAAARAEATTQIDRTRWNAITAIPPSSTTAPSWQCMRRSRKRWPPGRRL